MTASSVERNPPSLATVVGLGCTLIGAGIGAQRLADNSFLTHLATGREMLDSGIVREDVFTWTSAGESVVVQSWLASLIYALVEDVAGFGGLRLLMAVLAAGLGALTWRLTESAPSLVTRAVIMVPTLLIGLRTWTERPLLFAFVFFAFVILVLEDDRDVRPLGLLGVLWVNIHGSWPLVLGYLVMRALGRWLDGDPIEIERRAFAWLAGGIVLGGVANPYGARLLWFPIDLLGKQETLRHIAEWQASSFQSLWTRMFLVLVLGVVVAARGAKWRHLVPAMGFIGAALLSARNIPVAAIVVLPVLASGLPSLPGPSARYRSDAISLGAKAMAVLIVVLPLVAVRAPHVEAGRYPVEAVDAMEERGIGPTDVAVVHQDFVGNYLDLRYGGANAVWIDDRYELHEATLVEDYLVLLDGAPAWSDVIARHNPVAILWPSDRVLVELARATGDWVPIWVDDDWTVLCRIGRSGC